MYIMSQDKSVIVKPSTVRVEKNFTRKADEKFALTAVCDIANALPIELALYPTYEDAQAELERIFAAIQAGEATYAVR